MREIACFGVCAAAQTLLAKPQPRYTDILRRAHKSDFFTRTTVHESNILIVVIPALGAAVVEPAFVHRRTSAFVT